MDDTQFDLGEAYGEYEKAKADREFYLSMMQQGQQNKGAFMASPIAAYLAGVAGVKLASTQKNLMDAKIQREDALAAKERADKYGQKLKDNLYKIVSASNQGQIAPGSAATMVGALVKEMGYQPVSFDADNSILTYADGNGEEYELDLHAIPNYLQEGRAIRNEKARQDLESAKEKAEREKKKGALDIALKQKKLGAGSDKLTTLSNFNTTHKSVNEALNARVGKEMKMDRLSKAQVQDFIEGAESLSPADKKQVQAKIDELLNLAGKKGWSFTTSAKPEVNGGNNLNQLWAGLQ